MAREKVVIGDAAIQKLSETGNRVVVTSEKFGDRDLYYVRRHELLDDASRAGQGIGLLVAAAGVAVGAFGINDQQSATAQIPAALSKLNNVTNAATMKPFSFNDPASGDQAQENLRDALNNSGVNNVARHFNHLVTQVHSAVHSVSALAPHIRGNPEELIGAILVFGGLAVAGIASFARSVWPGYYREVPHTTETTTVRVVPEEQRQGQ